MGQAGIRTDEERGPGIKSLPSGTARLQLFNQITPTLGFSTRYIIHENYSAVTLIPTRQTPDTVTGTIAVLLYSRETVAILHQTHYGWLTDSASGARSVPPSPSWRGSDTGLQLALSVSASKPSWAVRA
jgi:hypothetical protein